MSVTVVHKSKRNMWEFFPMGIGVIPIYAHSQLGLIPIPTGNTVSMVISTAAVNCDVW